MIIVKLQGGLGNQMFQYAVGRVLSVKNNTELLLDTQSYKDATQRLFTVDGPVRNYDLSVFTIHARVAKRFEIPFLFRIYGKGKFRVFLDAVRRRLFQYTGHEMCFKKFNPKILALGPSCYLDGYFQSPKYFFGYEDVIRADFALKNKLPEHVKQLQNEIINTEALCIFVRRQDFIGNKYHEVVDKDYYDKGVRYLSKNTPIAKVYVFSDDSKWCEENLKFDIETMFVGNEYAGSKWEYHMFLMSCCKYFLIPNSTFAWWSAWLSERDNKVVMVPSVWSGDNSIDINDVVPEDWIRI